MTRAEKNWLRNHRTVKHNLMRMLASPNNYSLEDIEKYHPMICRQSLEETRRALT